MEIISTKTIHNKTPKQIAYNLSVTARTVRNNLKKYIDLNYLVLQDGRYLVTETGACFIDIISSASRAKKNRFEKQNKRLNSPFIDPKKYFNKFIYNLGEQYNNFSPEKRAVIIKIIKKIKDMNETREREMIQNLYVIFSEHLGQKPEYIKFLLEKHFETRGYKIHNLYAYTRAVLFDILLCGWKKLKFYAKSVVKTAPDVLADAFSYIEELKVFVTNKTQYARRVALDWMMHAKTHYYKMSLVDQIETRRVNLAKLRRKEAEIKKERAAADDYSAQLDSWFDSLPLDRQREIDAHCAIPHPMMIRANRSEFYSKEKGGVKGKNKA